MRSRLAAAALVPLLLAAAPRLHAQLAPGTWSGSITPPSGQTMVVTYEVARLGDSLTARIIAPMGEFPLRSLRLEDTHLRFSWDAGREITCDLLARPDRGYAGECVDDSGRGGQMIMLPPTGAVDSVAAPAGTSRAEPTGAVDNGARQLDVRAYRLSSQFAVMRLSTRRIRSHPPSRPRSAPRDDRHG